MTPKRKCFRVGKRSAQWTNSAGLGVDPLDGKIGGSRLQPQTALKIVAAEERTSVQSLLAEGINAVFARRHKAQIASLST
jgi:hypothetical protein